MKNAIKIAKMGNICLMKNKALICVIGFLTIIFISCLILFYVVYPLKNRQEIVYYSQKYNLNCALVSAIICAESRFNESAVSSSGASGLMQLMPTTYKWVKSYISTLSNDIFDVDSNICAGCYYLRYLLDKYSNIIYVLACYNAGEGIVSKWGSANNFNVDCIEYLETKNYVSKVLKLEKLYAVRFD